MSRKDEELKCSNHSSVITIQGFDFKKKTKNFSDPPDLV
jgi:hypothetical protein